MLLEPPGRMQFQSNLKRIRYSPALAPYFSYNQRGAQDPKYLRNPRPEEYETILAASDDIVRWSVAPELDGALEFGRRLAERGILPSIGHTDAIYEQVEEAYRHAGYTHVTHALRRMNWQRSS